MSGRPHGYQSERNLSKSAIRSSNFIGSAITPAATAGAVLIELMPANEIVVQKVDGDHCRVILNFLGESISKAG